MAIDIAFDFRTDARGKDPDSHSPTLRRYHRLLWSKPLPSGARFDLSDTTPGVYLHHSSPLGEFFLSSDGVMQTFTRWPALKPITEQFPESENEAFRAIGSTIGGMMVFPGNQIGRKQTINVARGFNKSISDRFDLTLECIRRHYSDLGSPLAGTLSRYSDFFALFGDFRGYVSFFVLHDLVTEDLGVKFFMSFDDFVRHRFPRMCVATGSTAAARSSSLKQGTIGSVSLTSEPAIGPCRRCPAGVSTRCTLAPSPGRGQ